VHTQSFRDCHVRSSQTDAAPSAVPWLVASKHPAVGRGSPAPFSGATKNARGRHRSKERGRRAGRKAELYTSFAACIMTSPADSCATWNFH
jgi:hypothetical protein